MKNTKKKKFNREPLFAVGDRIKHPKYGEGIVRKIDTNYLPDYDFFYDVDFAVRGGDGTKVWLPKAKTEKIAEKIVRQAKKRG